MQVFEKENCGMGYQSRGLSIHRGWLDILSFLHLFLHSYIYLLIAIAINTVGLAFS